MKKALKLLHIVGAIGFAGGLTAYMLILAHAPDVGATADYAALRASLAVVAKWMIVPSMIVSVCSGLLAMAFHFPYHDAPWVWTKAVTGVLIFEASLMSIDAPSQKAAEAAASAVAGEIDAATLASLVRDEWTAMWIVLGLAAFNIVMGAWRPRIRWFSRRGSADEATTE